MCISKDLYLDDKEDIFKAFTREYDFQINMKLYKDGSTDIKLSSHDSPMGETLYMIPIDMEKTELESEVKKSSLSRPISNLINTAMHKHLGTKV